jgi:regulatory protein
MPRSIPTLRARALTLLAGREMSRAQLARKLEAHLTDTDDLPALLDALEVEGALSDARFAALYVRSRAHRYGARRLAAALRDKGVADEHIAAALAELEDGTEEESELARARAVWAGKFDAPPKDFKERAKQMRFLLGRGFGLAVVQRALDARDEADGE